MLVSVFVAIETLMEAPTSAKLSAPEPTSASVVADSDAAREYEETMSKGKALLLALERAEQGLENAR